MSDFLSDAALRHLRRVTAATADADERYELLEVIGEGGMGTVHRAFDRRLERDVALKRLRGEAAHPGLVERLRREAAILARLEHPGVVPVHDLGQTRDGEVFAVMKLVDGEGLDRFVRRTDDLRRRLSVFERVCETVAFAHARGVLHRDLKPSNVMVGSFGEVLVLDWGLAKVIADGAAETVSGSLGREVGDTHHGAVLGTPGYMAPEQAEGWTEMVDERSDVHALGVILDELGRDARPSPDRRLRAVIERARHLDPLRRYASVEALREEIRRWLAGAAVEAHPEPWYERLARFAHRNRGILLLFAAYLVMRALVAWFSRS